MTHGAVMVKKLPLDMILQGDCLAQLRTVAR